MKIYALANELNLDRADTGAIVVPFGTWDYGEKKLEDGRTLYFRQTLDRDGAVAIAAQVAASVARGEKGVPVYWGHPDVPELAHKYPDKRAKGWVKDARVNYPRNDVNHGKLVLTVEWLDENATEGFGWFSPYWTGTVRETGGGEAVMTVNALASVALVNMPNIREFRLANELQDTNNAAKAEKGTNMNITKEELCELLGLPPEATDDEIRAAVKAGAKAAEEVATERTKAEAAEAEKAEAENECREAKEALANERKAHVGILLDNAIADGRISVAGRAAWEKRLADDFAKGRVALANEKPLKTASAVSTTPASAAKVDLVALANERMSKHPGMTYTAAFAAVMGEHPEIK